MVFSFIKLYLARKRLQNSVTPRHLKYASELLLGNMGNQNDFLILYRNLQDSDQLLRSGAILGIRRLLEREQLSYNELTTQIMNDFESSSLLTKLGMLSLLFKAPSELIFDFVSSHLKTTDHDLLYSFLFIAPINSQEHYLDALSVHAKHRDPTIQFIALLKWFEGIKQLPDNERIKYLSARFHTLIEVYRETGQGAEFIYESLDKGQKTDFPEPKLYDDNTIRSLVHLLDQFEFSKRAYENAYKLIVPEYFALSG